MTQLAPWHRRSSLWDQMSDLRRELDEVVDGWGDEFVSPQLALAVFPQMNVWEDADHVHVEAELPGVKSEDLEITLGTEDQLAVTGSRAASESKQAEWFRNEIPCGDFGRTILLPCSVDPKKVEACLENGVLTVQMSKSPAAKPIRIAVKPR